MLVWAYTSLELPVQDIFTMCATPSIVPNSISFIYSSIIKTLWDIDKRVMPFVARAAYNAELEPKTKLN